MTIALLTSILACAPTLVQAGSVSELTLDALIERLPRAYRELEGVGDESHLNPVSAELARRLHGGVALSGEQWRRALLGSGALWLPPRWPEGEPYVVSARNPYWLGDTVLILEPARPDLRRAHVGLLPPLGTCGTGVLSAVEALRNQELGELAPGAHHLTLRLDLRLAAAEEKWSGLHPWFDAYMRRVPGSERGVPSRFGGDPRMPSLLSTSELTVDVQVVPTIDAAVLPDSSAALTETVRSSLALVSENAGSGPWYLSVLPLPELEQVGLSLEVEVLRAREVVGRTALHPTREYLRWEWIRGSLAHRLFSLPPRLDPAERSRWSLRIHGTSVDILESWAERRWAGTLELPLDELLERGAAQRGR